jgi:hypothetical protein
MDEILSRLAFDLKLKEELMPWRHFDLMIGTGPGGLVRCFSTPTALSNPAFRLVVILIGRLRLSPSSAIDAYIKLVAVIPTHAALSDEERKRNSESFKSVFVEVLEDAGFDQNTPMMDEDGPKM